MINDKEASPLEATLSRRRLLINSAQLTAVAATMLRTGSAVGSTSVEPAEVPKLTEEIAGHWTTF